MPLPNKDLTNLYLLINLTGGILVVVDGHTKKGEQRVDLDAIFTVDEIKQLIRSLDWALMMDSHEDKPGHPQRMDVLAHREFIKGTRDKLQQSLNEQGP